ncbi:disease resistance protein RPV1 [Eucalyptus grandis]|uniref:disease resistance protein RPV1 n=1 Tax=Eucalyptus grandis TaxID=71139 RepID=UPI00192E99D2|nr:disease resistance protein RPV1 [Eucalyptus grandis]
MEESAKRRRTGGNDGTAGGASSTDASTEGQEAATSWRHDYEVFLSFRGPDTRQGFTDFLYRSLKRVGIRTFRDDDELPMGGKIGPELFEAIEQSKILIPIFSKGYASSEWCLNELVRMVECQENERQKIMPIFYDVAPSEVRCQTGKYEEVFRSHEEQYDRDTICKWKAALSAVAAKKGWDLLSKTTRREGEFAEEVTEQVFRELKQAYLAVSDHLVSVDNDVDAIMEVIGAPTSETQIIGIHGMGGVGKTTIAKIIYNKLSSNFNNCCFLANIRETSITCLQKQLISDILKVKQMDINNKDDGIGTIKKMLSNERVLLLLDDVEQDNHIDALVGKRDWFGRGSKIIITTRRKDILYFPKVDCTYEVSVMDDDRSLQLFSKHAFRRNSPLDEDMDRSIKAIRIAQGLPLALEVIGSLLCRTEKEKWDGQLKDWEYFLPKDVMSTLKISYNALSPQEQCIFLDIACLFIGYDKDIVVHFWDARRGCPEVVIGALQNMSLIKIIEHNKVWMHDLLRDLGRGIVHQDNIREQSRVWDPKEGLDLLRKHKGEKRVEALRLKLDNHQQYRFSYEGFENLSHLRFLEVMKNLKVLDMSDCPLLERLPDSIGNLESLIEFDISNTSIKELPNSVEI